MENISGNKRKLKKLYTSLIPTIKKVGKKHGYAMAIHGSLTRDMDILAVPWVENVSSEHILVRAVTKSVKGLLVDTREIKPHNRVAYTILLTKYSGTKGNPFIDLSIIQPSL